jgi:hypothetical protein
MIDGVLLEESSVAQDCDPVEYTFAFRPLNMVRFDRDKSGSKWP